MRLWTVHPKYLDGVGLVALWREALLARAVLRGDTRGYRYHPQLIRFRALPDPVGALNRYLEAVYFALTRPEAHPLFRIVPGVVRTWERVGPGAAT